MIYKIKVYLKNMYSCQNFTLINKIKIINKKKFVLVVPNINNKT